LIAIVVTSALSLITIVVASALIGRKTDEQTVEIRDRNLPKIAFCVRLENQLEHIRVGLEGAVHARSLDALDHAQALEGEFFAELDRSHDMIEPAQALLLHGAVARYCELAVDVSRRRIQGEASESLVDAMSLTERAQAQAQALLRETTTFDREQLAAALSAAVTARTTRGHMRLIISALCLLAVLLLSLRLLRRVLRSVRALDEGLTRFGRGDFSRPILVEVDELGHVAASANEMAANLKALAAERERQAERLSEQEEELRATNEELQAHHEELQQTNAELEQTAEELAVANRELTQISRVKSDFLSMMSHELRTPLNAINGFSALLYDQRWGPLNERQLQFVSHVHEGGKHLLALINDLLDLSKIEAGHLEIEVRPCSPRALAEDAIATFLELAKEKRIALSLSTASDTVPVVSADPVRAKQALYNLISNAIKFTPSGGEVSVHFEPLPADNRLRFIVSDSGPGIEAAELERLFQPFSQLENAKLSPHGGTGLGLSLTRRLVELMGGRAGVESTPGKGSRFYFDLPVHAAAAVATEVAPASGMPLALVVDDDPSTRSLLEATLRRGGYDVIFAATGEEALVQARVHRPQVITLDIALPGIDGWDVLRALREDASIADTPVVMVSVSDDRHKAFGLGVLDYLVKPVQSKALLDAIERRAFLPKTSTRQKHILVVDDDLQHLELMRAALEPRGFRVTTTATGRDGLAAAQHEVDLLVLDLVLPDLSGVEVIEALRTDVHTRLLPILLVTNADLSAADRHRLHGDVEAILAKSSNGTESLTAEIERVVRRRP
jgi:signal transduction histidine kinase/CheY-like chemotaxis protein